MAIRGTFRHFVFHLVSLVRKTECLFISYFLILTVRLICDNFILCLLRFFISFLFLLPFYPLSFSSFSLFTFFIFPLSIFRFPFFLFSLFIFLFSYLYSFSFFLFLYSFFLFSIFLFFLFLYSFFFLPFSFSFLPFFFVSVAYPVTFAGIFRVIFRHFHVSFVWRLVVFKL